MEAKVQPSTTPSEPRVPVVAQKLGDLVALAKQQRTAYDNTMRIVNDLMQVEEQFSATKKEYYREMQKCLTEPWASFQIKAPDRAANGLFRAWLQDQNIPFKPIVWRKYHNNLFDQDAYEFNIETKPASTDVKQ